MITSKKWTLNWRDWLEGLFAALGTGAIDYVVANMMETFTWKGVAAAALSGGLLYIKYRLAMPAQRITKAE